LIGHYLFATSNPTAKTRGLTTEKPKVTHYLKKVGTTELVLHIKYLSGN